MSKLTNKQEAFCQEYLIDLNATQAAIRAGYSVKTAREQASQNLSKLNISERVSELQKERAERVQIDADWVLNQAVKLHNRCMQSEKVVDKAGDPVLDDDGNPVYKFEHAGASKSLELIGKHVNVQAFSEKVVSETTVTVKETLAEKLKRGSRR